MASAPAGSGVRLYDATRGRLGPVLGWGAGVAVAFFAVWLVAVAVVDAPGAALADRPAFGPASWAEVVVRALVLGYTVTLPAIGLRLASQQLGLLGPHLVGPESESAVRRALHVPRRARWVGLAVGAAILVGFGGAFYQGQDDLRVLTTLWFAAFGALLGDALATHLRIARAFSSLGRHCVPVDLLDRRPFAPLVAWGLRIFLAWVVWFGVTSLFFFDPGPRPPNWSNLLSLLPLAFVGIGALLVPAWGIHGRLREAKQAELARLDEAIRRERDTLWRDGASSSPQLANLAGYRSLVAAQSDWPLDVSTWLRFGFYLAIGAGSWVGAALVEQLLGRALG